MGINLSDVGRACAATAVIASTALLGLPSAATAAPGGSIAGTVRNHGGSALEDICVNATEGGPYGSHVGSANTQPDGTYLLTGLPAGDIYLYFRDCNSPAQYVGEWYDGTYNGQQAVPVNLVADGSATGIDAALSPGVTVSGNVTGPNGDPVKDVHVSVDSQDFDGAHGWDQTDDFGDYTTSPVLPGDYRVRFEAQDEALAVEYWDDATSWDSAKTLTLDGSGPVANINAQLSLGGSISGTVTNPTGGPASDACVEAFQGSDDDPEHVAYERTDASGNYTLKQLPVGQYRVYFDDCEDDGVPYLGEFYQNTTDFDEAQILDVTAGISVPGIDAQMTSTARIRGTVKNTGGTPLPGICVQASTDAFTGGSDNTDSDGTYSIEFVYGGKYKVQFVDCGDVDEDPPITGGTYLAQWSGGGLEPATAKEIDATLGSTVDGIDATLATAGGTGTVTGRVTNIRDEPLKACVVLYLPFEHVRFGMTDINGDYSFADVPTGTWSIGFLGCGEEDVSPVIPDTGDTGVFFNAVWFDGKQLQLDAEEPDPIAQGATLVTIGPGEAFEADMRFGHEAVKVKPPIIGEDFILVDFDTTGLTTDDAKNSIKAADLTYHVGCDSKTGASTSASQDNYPVKVSGFTPGAPYVCSAQVLSNGVDVADSTSFEVTVGTATPTEPGGEPSGNPTSPTQPSNDTGGSAAQPVSYNTSGATPAKLAYTGGNTAAAGVLATFMILMGIGAITTSMRMDSHQDRRRATS